MNILLIILLFIFIHFIKEKKEKGKENFSDCSFPHPITDYCWIKKREECRNILDKRDIVSDEDTSYCDSYATESCQHPFSISSKCLVDL